MHFPKFFYPNLFRIGCWISMLRYLHCHDRCLYRCHWWCCWPSRMLHLPQRFRQCYRFCCFGHICSWYKLIFLLVVFWSRDFNWLMIYSSCLNWLELFMSINSQRTELSSVFVLLISPLRRPNIFWKQKKKRFSKKIFWTN